MVSLRLFAIVLLTLFCRELAGNEPRLTLSSSLLTTMGMTLGFGLLVKSFALSVLNGGSTQAATIQTKFQSRRKFADITWCCFLPAALLATDWTSWLNSLELQGFPQALAIFCCFLPTMAFVILSEVTAAQFDEISDELDGRDETGWLVHLRIRLRLGDFAGLIACILPVLMISFFADLGTLIPSYLLVAKIEPNWLTAIASTATLLLFLIAFPSCLSRWSGATAMADSQAADRVKLHLRSLKLSGVEPLVIQSNNRWAGAAIVGWIPYFRKLWLGDALIANLSERELDMVILHELAHIQRKHFLWRTLPVVGLATVSILAWGALQQLVTQETLLLGLQLMVIGVCGAALLSTLGAVAQLCELDADRHACELARLHCDWARSQSPNAVLSEALSRLVPDASGNSPTTWLHPSLKSRLENLSTANGTV